MYTYIYDILRTAGINVLSQGAVQYVSLSLSVAVVYRLFCCFRFDCLADLTGVGCRLMYIRVVIVLEIEYKCLCIHVEYLTAEHVIVKQQYTQEA